MVSHPFMRSVRRTLRTTLFVVVLGTTTFTTGCDVAMISQIVGGLLTAFSTQVDDPTLGTAMRAVGAGLGFAAGDGNVQAEEVLQASAAAFANDTLAQQGIPVQIGPNGQINTGQMPQVIGQNGATPPFSPPVNMPAGQNETFRSYRELAIRMYNDMVGSGMNPDQAIAQATQQAATQVPGVTPDMVNTVQQELVAFVRQQAAQTNPGGTTVATLPDPGQTTVPPTTIPQGPVGDPTGPIFDPGQTPPPVMMPPGAGGQVGVGQGGVNVGFQFPIGDVQVGGNFNFGQNGQISGGVGISLPPFSFGG